MAEPGGAANVSVAWGPAELAAVDLCLANPGLSERSTPKARLSRLSRTIEAEIIPRLMLAHRENPEPVGDEDEFRPSAAEVAELAGLVITRDLPTVLGNVHALIGRGHSIETVLLEVLAPAARLLGDMWRDDLCTFADVTIGLSQLQQVLRTLTPGFEGTRARETCGRILIAPVPGDQHSFGTSMVEGFFRRAGWDVDGGFAASASELTQLVRDDWFDVIGLSLGCSVLFDHVRPVIQALRKASRNPSVFVMVGGRFFVDHPTLASEVGADAAASDAPDALRRAHASLGHVLARC